MERLHPQLHPRLNQIWIVPRLSVTVSPSERLWLTFLPFRAFAFFLQNQSMLLPKYARSIIWVFQQCEEMGRKPNSKIGNFNVLISCCCVDWKKRMIGWRNFSWVEIWVNVLVCWSLLPPLLKNRDIWNDTGFNAKFGKVRERERKIDKVRDERQK